MFPSLTSLAESFRLHVVVFWLHDDLDPRRLNLAFRLGIQMLLRFPSKAETTVVTPHPAIDSSNRYREAV